MNIKNEINPAGYQKYVSKLAPKSKLLRECVSAFLVGGAICTLGEGIRALAAGPMNLDKEASAAFCATVLVFLGALFTGIGWYDVLGKFAGAGSIVPITGFANSMVAPALEFKREGLVLGTGAKLFTIAGPVLVYGIGASAMTGLVYAVLIALGVGV